MQLQQFIGSHPLAGAELNDALLRSIEACLACAQACTSCADACLAERAIVELSQCIRLNLDSPICALPWDASQRGIRAAIRA